MANAILIGGGLDSTILTLSRVLQFQERPLLIHVKYGQKAAASEWVSVRRTAEALGLDEPVQLSIDLSFSGSHIMEGTPVGVARKSNVLSQRNPVLISMACSYLGSVSGPSTLYIGFHREPEGKVFPDADAAYLPALEAVLRTCGGSTCLRAPFMDMSRQQIVDLGLTLHRDLVLNCHTCYESVPCGSCTHCVERNLMLSLEK